MHPVLVALALAAAAPAPKEVPKKDPPTLVGVWTIESAIKGGRPDNSPPGATLELTADGKMVLRENGKDITGTYKSDPKKEVPEIDLHMDAGGAMVTMAGIFKLDGQTLQVCLALAGDRPTAFASPEGALTVLLTMKRTKKD